MSESMSSPWIRDYLLDIAETYGAQLYNAPVSNKKKRVQLTDLLAYQEESYVWAWVSDKDHRVSVRISKDAAEQYKSIHQRSVIDSRFCLVFVSDYRPMFSPRPLGSNTIGNTLVSHISLEVGHIHRIGTGGHLFGHPRDLESDDNMKEWVLGLRQDGGGGNVLKLRKQQELVQDKKDPSQPPLPAIAPLSVSHHQSTKTTEIVAKPKPERPQDPNRLYAKRWRKVGVNKWKFTIKPVVLMEEQSIQETELGCPDIEPISDSVSPPEHPMSPHRTPSPPPSRRQGTPTDWSPSNRGSPVATDGSNTFDLANGIQQLDEPEVLPIASHLPSDTERHISMGTAITSITHSQPLTPAQRAKRSPIHRSSPTRSSPEPLACPSPPPSQQPPHSSPLPPSSSLPLLSSSLPTHMGVRKIIQRKVPHPGLPFPRPDPTKQSPVQILVPNSDTSGTGSSKSHPHSQHISQSQQSQAQLMSYSPAFPSSLAKEFKPADASTRRGEKPIDTSLRVSKMFAESSSVHGGVDKQETTPVDDKHATEKADANAGKQESGSSQPPPPIAPKIEVLVVATSDAEEENDDSQPTYGTIRTNVVLDTDTDKPIVGKEGADADPEDNQPSVTKVQIHPMPQSSPLPPPKQHSSPNKQGTDEVPTRRSAQLSKRPGSQSPMHSLFSESLGDEQGASSLAPKHSPRRAEDAVQEKASLAQTPRHDPEAWKEPSFIAKRREKGKSRAVEDLDAPSVQVGKKRRRSGQQESSVPKRTKVAAPERRRAMSSRGTIATSGHVQPQGTLTSAVGKKSSNERPKTDPTETAALSPAMQLFKPRLANFTVDFGRIDLGKGLPIPRLDLENDIKGTSLRTGRIQTLGKEVEKEVYIFK